MSLTIRRLIALAATLVLVTAVTSCAESQQPVATGKGNIRGINAIVTALEIAFLIEERTLGNVNYKGTSGFDQFDDLSYNFNFDLFLRGELDRTRLSTQFIDVVADQEYTVVLTGTVANPSSFFWEDTIREWDGTETVAEIVFAHLAPSMGELDVYFAAPGTVPVPGQAVGSLTNGNRLPGLDVEAASYELILTPKDDPATIIYQSQLFGAIAQIRITIAIFDADPSVTANVGVNIFGEGGASLILADINFPAQLRTLHAALGTGNFDGYFDSNFADIIYSDIGFKELSPYGEVTQATTLLTLTATGNSGATIRETDVTVGLDSKRTVVLAGTPGTPVFVGLVNDARPLETYPLVRILNASLNTQSLDIYMLEPGTPIDDVIVPQIRGIPPLRDTGFSDSAVGMLEFTITLFTEKTPIATPLILDLSNGDIVDIVIVDTVDPTMVEMVVFDSQLAP